MIAVPEEGERERLESYREEVLREVQVRSDRLRSIEQNLEHKARMLEEVQGGKLAGAQSVTRSSASSGRERGTQGGEAGARTILAVEAVRKKIVRELEQLKEERVLAAEDLVRAQERIQLVEAELAELDAVDVASTNEQSEDNDAGRVD